ncbi:MAG: hypothetical protein QOG01_4107 [Pseudonocardiales bacterium]|jgi:hypothetical protein|nr:hypothetical protein [Pseudonocardiales bacterium]
MSEDPGHPRRRRRRQASAAQGPPTRSTPPPAAAPPAAKRPPTAAPPAGADIVEAAASPEPARKRRAPREPSERGLRDIVGAGSSQLGVSGALRGRDVNRPTDEDLLDAERDVVIVRRNWKPDDKR